MIVGGWVAAAFAGAHTEDERAVIERVTPAFPDAEIACRTTLAVAADGSVAGSEVKGCKRYAGLVSEALSQWRFAPAPGPTEQRVSFARQPGMAPGIHRWVAPTFGADAPDGAQCVAHLWVGADGVLDRLVVDGCGDPAAAQFTDAILQWQFDPAPAPREQFSTAFALHRAPISRVSPSFPQNTGENAARCQVIATIGADGEPTVNQVVGCPEPFAGEAADAVGQWRWKATSSSWATTVGVTFVRTGG